MIEIFFTCWLVMLANGDLFCYCEGEPAPVATEQVVSVEAFGGKVPLYEETR